MDKDIQTYDEKLLRAVADVKEAILQGQYEACKVVNRIQLAVYFGIMNIGHFWTQNRPL